MDRLQQLIAAVPPCEVIADIGTDHGYVPMTLVKKGIIRRAIASDVASKPLASAKRHIEKAGLTEVIACRLGSGLETIKVGEVDGIVIAGMGGALMRDLLCTALDVVNQLSFMVLQPMNGAEVIREMVNDIGWHIEEEWLVTEGERVYEILRARQGRERPYTIAELWLGRRIIAQGGEVLRCQKERVLYRLRHECEGLARSRQEKDKARLAARRALYEEVERI